MRIGRLRTGELLALAGAALLLVTLFLRWFGLEERGSREASTAYAPLDLPSTGLSQLGWFVVAVCLAAVALCTWMVLAGVRRGAGPAVMATVFTVVAAASAFALVGLRLLIDQPDLGADLPSSAVAIRTPAYLGLLGAALLLAGAWRALADERLDAPESAYVPPPARPVPPAGPNDAPAPTPPDPA